MLNLVILNKISREQISILLFQTESKLLNCLTIFLQGIRKFNLWCFMNLALFG